MSENINTDEEGNQNAAVEAQETSPITSELVPEQAAGSEHSARDSLEGVQAEVGPSADDADDEVTSNHLDLVQLTSALLFASGEPLSIEQMALAVKRSDDEISAALIELENRLRNSGVGVQLTHVAEKYQLRTFSECGPFVRQLKASRPRRLSAAALETLAIVAYRQPIVKSDVERLRGVDVSPTLKTLLERQLVRIVGHQQTVGQPALYGTTEEFLKLFGLRSLRELPTIRDITELEREPGESEVQVAA